MANRRFIRRWLSLLVTIAAPMLYIGLAGCDRTTHLSEAPVSTPAPTSTPVSSPPPLSPPPLSPPPLIEATLADNLEDVRSLLRNGIDPNGVYHTNTALTYAARDGFTDIACVLIDHGADVNWIDGEGVTPLILASFKGHVDLVQLLLDHRADTTIRDQWNRTALDYALRRGDVDPIVQLLQ